MYIVSYDFGIVTFMVIILDNMYITQNLKNSYLETPYTRCFAIILGIFDLFIANNITCIHLLM